MAPLTLQHRRSHNLLLISKLLNQRDGVSPFTLILDGLEQSGRPLVAEYLRRAPIARATVIYISFETLRKPVNVDVYIEAWDQDLRTWQTNVETQVRSRQAGKTLVVIDSLNSLSALHGENLPAILSTLIGPSISLLATYHTDVTLASKTQDSYSPAPLTLLRYMATTIFTAISFPHALARKSARERSLAEPSFGLYEGKDGVLQGLGANAGTGMVIEMEHRRKSGRGVQEAYFLPVQSHKPTEAMDSRMREIVTLLEDHPSYRSQQQSDNDKAPVEGNTVDATFELGLTEKQRRDREAVVLPYFDAQRGSAEGGRILYDMGEEDDFDEEEDEI